MDRTEKTGLGVAIAGHVLLFALLSASFLFQRKPMPSHPSMDVTLATEAALESAAPKITQQPAQSQAPEAGPPAEAAPATPQQAAPEPQPAPPQPRPAPAPKPAPVAQPQPPKPAAAKAKPQPAHEKSQGTATAATKPRERGSHLGPDFLKGITADASPSKVEAPRASKVGAQDIANIEGLIKRQVQPCYDLGALKGTSAMSIVTALRLQFRQDGSIAAATVSDQQGVNADNQRYARQMGELSRRAVLRCSPLRGLPPTLYQNGWNDFDMYFTPSDFG